MRRLASSTSCGGYTADTEKRTGHTATVEQHITRSWTGEDTSCVKEKIVCDAGATGKSSVKTCSTRADARCTVSLIGVGEGWTGGIAFSHVEVLS